METRCCLFQEIQEKCFTDERRQQNYSAVISSNAILAAQNGWTKLEGGPKTKNVLIMYKTIEGVHPEGRTQMGLEA